MGLFDFLKKGDSPKGEEKELARLQKMVANKLAQNADREDALYRLAQMGTPGAARVLLTRFNWTLNPSIKDQEEKEQAVRGIAAAGESALEEIRKYCSRSETLTWPLKALRNILSGEKLEQELLSVLDEFDTDYMRNPEPKVQLVQTLGDFSSEDVRIAVEPFLTDLAEDVRFAAVTTVLGCDSPESLDSLVAGLAEEESLRVKNRIAIGLVNKGWSISPELSEQLQASLPDGFAIAGGRLTGQPVS